MRGAAPAPATASQHAMARGRYVFDTSRWPVVRVELQGLLSAELLREVLAEHDRFLDEERRYGIIVDGRQAEPPSASARRVVAEWQDRVADQLRELCVGVAFLFDSPLQRGALTALLWISPLQNPHVVVSREDEALRWIEGRLVAAGRRASARP